MVWELASLRNIWVTVLWGVVTYKSILDLSSIHLHRLMNS